MLASLALTLAAVLVRQSVVDVTPPEPLPMGGYTERGSATFEPGGQTLLARTLILESGWRKLAWVAFETLTVSESLVAKVRASAPKGTDVVVSATHTHCAPDSQLLNDRMTMQIPGIATYKARWLEWTADKLSEGIRLAEGAEPTQAGHFDFYKATTQMNRGRRDGAAPDPNVYRVYGGGKRLFELFAAHPVLLGPEHRKLDGEWIGRLMRKTGSIALTGALGDVSPVPPDTEPENRPEAFATALAKLLDSAKPQIAGQGVDWTFEPIPLGNAIPHPDFAKTNKVPEVLAKLVVAKFAPPKAELVALRLGTVLLLGVPGEPTAAVGNQLVEAGRKAGFTNTLVASHVGGWVGYILTPAEYARGGYEATLAFNGPDLASRLVQAAQKAAHRMSQTR